MLFRRSIFGELRAGSPRAWPPSGCRPCDVMSPRARGARGEGSRRSRRCVLQSSRPAVRAYATALLLVWRPHRAPRHPRANVPQQQRRPRLPLHRASSARRRCRSSSTNSSSPASYPASAVEPPSTTRLPRLEAAGDSPTSAELRRPSDAHRLYDARRLRRAVAGRVRHQRRAHADAQVGAAATLPLSIVLGRRLTYGFERPMNSRPRCHWRSAEAASSILTRRNVSHYKRRITFSGN